MKKLKAGYVTYCSWCKESDKKVQALFRASGLRPDKRACEEHVPTLKEYEAANRDDGYMTEADYQTWGRL